MSQAVRLTGSCGPGEDGNVPQTTRSDFEHLLAFRVSLRRFQRWSEDQAQAAGLTHVQHQNDLTPTHLAELHDLAAVLDELVASADGGRIG
jgi:hypothetical protein